MPYPSRALRASLPLLLVLVAGGALIARREVQSTPVPPAVAPDPARTQRLAWFREAKYGLFIHWGLYSIPAGEWQGRRSLGLGEWIMNRSQIPVKEYEQLAQRFNPVRFDADAWVQLAQDAGMRYIVITSKHHDGFAMFKSSASPYNIVDATPFKRDVLKELADACAKRGMRLGFYYSQAQDWHEPGGAGNTWDFGPDQGPDGRELKKYDDYLRGKAEPQVRELLTGYGPVALIWFDTPRMMTPERGKRFTDLVRSLQPATLIDGRLGTDGDYRSTGDNVIPAEAADRSLGDAGDDQRHLGLPHRRHELEVAGADHLQAARHREQGRQLPPQRRPDVRGRDSTAEPGDPADGRTLAESERRGGVRRRAVAVRRGVRRVQRERCEERARREAFPSADRVAGDDEAGEAVFHVLQRAAGAFRAAGDEERADPSVRPGHARTCRAENRRRACILLARPADVRSDGYRRRRRV